jgi:hypothetical protein
LHEELFTLPAAFLARDLLSVFCSTKCWAFLCFISALHRWGAFR